MALVIELRRGVSASRTGRKAGPSLTTGMLERIVVDDEFWTALESLGRHRSPPWLTSIPTGTPRCAVRQWTGWCGSWKVHILLAEGAEHKAIERYCLGPALPRGQRPADCVLGRLACHYLVL